MRIRTNTVQALVALSITWPAMADQETQIWFTSTLGDKISILDNRLGNAQMYGFGVEAGALYYKSHTLHRWYAGANADAGASSIMELSTTKLAIRPKVVIGSTTPNENLSIYGSNGGTDPQTFGIGPADVRRWTFKADAYNYSPQYGVYPLIIEHNAAGYSGDFVVKQQGGDLVVKQDGKVGIGTASPAHKLSVNGTIQAKEVVVESGWADFVFESDYALRPLGEVENHISEHGRLPGVPSAAQVASDGLSLGEAQRIMMQKIEELTLYMIEKDKQVAALQEEVSALREWKTLQQASGATD